MDLTSASHQILLSVYDAIHTKNLRPMKQDSLLLDPPELCKAVWTEGIYQPTDAVKTLYEDLQQLSSKGLIYTEDGVKGGRLHWTVFQTETFPVTQISKDIKQEADTLRTIVGSFPPFSLALVGIRRTRFGLFFCGYPSFDVNLFREKIRSELPDVREPHPQDICHVTLFRFTETPTDEDYLFLDQICEKYKNTHFYTFLPKRYVYGYGTWSMLSPLPLYSWNAAPLLWILHRGLQNGPSSELENQEEILWARVKEGWHVELDLWIKDKSLWLGHDGPQRPLRDHSLLHHPNVWIHAKHLPAAQYCLEHNYHCFVHDTDCGTLTSKQYLWCYPGSSAGPRSIVVLPERAFVPLGALSKGTLQSCRKCELQDTIISAPALPALTLSCSCNSHLTVKDMFSCAGVCSDYLPSHFTQHTVKCESLCS